MTELKKANDNSKALITEKQILNINLKLNEKRREDLEKFIEKLKKNAHEKEVKLAELKLKVDKLNEEHDLASKRMHQLSFEYFDVAKKSEIEISKSVTNFKLNKLFVVESSHCPKCGLMYGVRVFDNFKCILRCSYKCGYHACARCIKRVLDDSTIEGRRCPKCGEDFKKEDILKA